jgi:hypothetical protein
MTPSVREVLTGCTVALMTPPSADAGPDYAASRAGMVSMMLGLATQEAEHAAGAAIAENADIRGVFAQCGGYDDALGGRLSAAAGEADLALDTPTLDAVNARLRRLLIELHEAVEAADDAETNRAIIALYGRMAQGRRMALGGGR